MPPFEIIKDNRDFQMIFEKGHSVSALHIVVYFHPNGLPINRFGFCVGKKIGSAVRRNRVKRLLREAVRRIVLPLSGYDILLVARPAVYGKELTDIYNELRNIIDRYQQKGCPNHLKTEDSQ